MNIEEAPPGIIGVVHRPIGYAATWGSIIQMDKPPLTGTITMVGTALAEQRNTVVKGFLERPAYKWLLFIDDDQVFPPDALARLLAHDKPIVAGLIAQKYPPFAAQFFMPTGDREHPLTRATKEQSKGRDLVEIGAVGCGFMLIQRAVLEITPYPWFAARWDSVGEDVYFCLKARDHGHTVWIDKSLRVGHLTIVSVLTGEDGEPVFTQDKWMPREKMTG